MQSSADKLTVQDDAGQSRAIMWTIYAVQFFFGGWFLAHGLNHWLDFFPRPSGSSPISRDLIMAMNASGIFDVVKVIEVITGVMFLVNRFVPLAVIGAFPVALSIALLNWLANPDLFSKIVAVLIMLFIVIIALGHLDKFIPMLSNRSGDPSERGIASFFAGRGFVSRSQSMGPLSYILCIAAGIAAPIAVTFWTTSDSGARSEAHYAEVDAEAMSTREVIEAFEQMAIEERNPAGAITRYFAEDVIEHDPSVVGDRQSIIDYLNERDWSTDGPQRTIKNIIVEDDLGMVHHHIVRTPGAPGVAAVDIFRVEDGQVVEHWDVMQPVPEDSPNTHGMF